MPDAGGLAGRGASLAVVTLAWRSIWRRKGRSLTVAAAVGAVVWLTLCYFGLLGGVGNAYYARVTEQTGHLQVRAAGWREERQLENLLIHAVPEVQARIRAVMPQAQVVPVLEVPALLSGTSRSRGVVLVGQAPPRWLEERLSTGHWYGLDEPDAIVLGAALARALRVEVGDWVYAYVPGSLGLGAGAFRVVGLLDLPEPGMEARAAYLPLRALQEVAAPESATRLEVHVGIRRLADDAELEPMRRMLADALGEGLGTSQPALSVETWREVNPSLARLIELVRPMTAVVTALFFVMAGLLVLNSVYLSLMERIREFGTIIALGASRARVLALVVLESTLLTATGGAVGLVLGLATVERLANGFTYPYVDLERYGLPNVLYTSLEPVDVVITVTFTLVTAVLAALWPGLVAARLQPVEAMRFKA